MKFNTILFVLFLVLSPSSMSNMNIGALGQQSEENNTTEDISEYESIAWWKLLSEDEFNFYTSETAKISMDPQYKGGTKPPLGVNENLNGKKIQISGYIVGVDSVQGEYNKLSTFLFVPNAGTCIHIPPPPPNQTIFVEMKKAIKTDPFEPVILKGTIYLENGESEIASYFYRFVGDSVKKIKL